MSDAYYVANAGATHRLTRDDLGRIEVKRRHHFGDYDVTRGPDSLGVFRAKKHAENRKREIIQALARLEVQS